MASHNVHIIYIFIVQAPSILWKLEGGDGIEEVFFGSSKNGRGMKHGDKSRFLGPSYSIFYQKSNSEWFLNSFRHFLWIRTLVDDLKTFWMDGWLFCKKTSEMHFRPIFRRPPIRSMQSFFQLYCPYFQRALDGGHSNQVLS